MPRAGVDFRVFQDGIVERAFHTGFKETVVVGQFQHPLAILPQWVKMAFQLDFRLGQRAGLVGTKNIHAAQIENGAEPLDDHLARRHAQRTARQRHGNDHR